jgi:hypothetical protein
MRARSEFDQTRAELVGHFGLPFGKGKKLMGDANPFLNGIVVGWSLNGI